MSDRQLLSKLHQQTSRSGLLQKGEMHKSVNRPVRISSLLVLDLVGPSSSTSNSNLGVEYLNKAIKTASRQLNLPSHKPASLYSNPLWQNHSFSLRRNRQPHLFVLVDSINKVAIDLKTKVGPVINSKYD